MGSHYSHLSTEERGVIMVMKAQGRSGREMARILGRASSTVTRELRRNRWRGGLGVRPPAGYDATRAGARARRLRRKP